MSEGGILMALIECNFYAETLQRTVTFNAILPTDKSLFSEDQRPADEAPSQDRGFKTLYLLHGVFGNYTDWLGGTRIQMWAQEKDLAVIMPSGDNRWWIDDRDGDPLLGNYGQFVGQELVDFTRRSFPLSDRREDTFVAGLSMGGYGALVNGLRYHDTFSRIGALSPGLMLGDLIDGYDDGEEAELRFPLGDDFTKGLERAFGAPGTVAGSDYDYKGLLTRLKAEGAEIPGIYLACGESDFMLGRAREFHRFLQRQGVEHPYVETAGGHDWTFWDAQIKEIIDWLPLDENARDGRHSGNVLQASAA